MDDFSHLMAQRVEKKILFFLTHHEIKTLPLKIHIHRLAFFRI